MSQDVTFSEAKIGPMIVNSSGDKKKPNEKNHNKSSKDNLKDAMKRRMAKVA